MALVANLALFFVFYLPLTFGVGLLSGFYVGPTQGPDDAYPLFIWVVVILPLLLPSFLSIPVAHVLLRIGRRRLAQERQRLVAVLLVPAGLLAFHLGFWGDTVLSLPLLMLMIVPGVGYGLIFRLR